MSLIKIPNKAVEFLKNNQDEIFKSGNLAEGLGIRDYLKKLNKFQVLKMQ